MPTPVERAKQINEQIVTGRYTAAMRAVAEMGQAYALALRSVPAPVIIPPGAAQALVVALGEAEGAIARVTRGVRDIVVAKEKAERERGEAAGILEYALHLRMHGENAPGGDETWDCFDRMAEEFLRARMSAGEMAEGSAVPSYPPVRVPENTGQYPKNVWTDGIPHDYVGPPGTHSACVLGEPCKRFPALVHEIR